MREFLTKGDAARVADLSSSGVRWAVNEGRLRVAARTVGGIALFERGEVERFSRERQSRLAQVTPPREAA